ncbi:glutathione S-transferase U17-like [Wolffia australiana]
MTGEEVKVLGTWGSPYAMRPRIALNLKKVHYEFIPETMFPKSELLLKCNPVNKQIPVLLHKGVPVCESLVILEYIDETWNSGPSLLPSDPFSRSLARFWAAYLDQKWYPQLREIRAASSEEERAASAEKIHVGMKLMEEAFKTCSEGGKWFGGDSLGYLDIALGCFLAWIRVTEEIFGLTILDETKCPQLSAWAVRFCAEEAVKEVMPETDKLAEFAKGLIARQKAALGAK